MAKVGDAEKDEVTFVIPMKNAELTIVECLESIVAQAGEQDYKVRIVVVDDASQDNSVAKVTRFKAENDEIDVTLVRNKSTQGRAATRNIGLSHVQTLYVAFVDSDVTLPPHWLEKSIQILRSDTNVACVSASVQPDGYLSHFSSLFGVPVIPKRPTNDIQGANLLCMASIIDESGGFDVRMRDGEDTDLGYRLLRRGFKTYFFDDFQSKHRVQPSFKSLMRRSFSHGRAGTLLFVRYRKLKLQDMAFLALLVLIFVGVVFWIFLGPLSLLWLLLVGVLMLLVGGTLFSLSTFRLSKRKRVLPLLAVVSSVFLLVYLMGRLVGIFPAIRHAKTLEWSP